MNILLSWYSERRSQLLCLRAARRAARLDEQ